MKLTNTLTNKVQTLNALNLTQTEYLTQRKTLAGCYNLLTQLVRLDIDLCSNPVFNSVDSKFVEILDGMEARGEDVSVFRKKYDALFEVNGLQDDGYEQIIHLNNDFVISENGGRK